MALITIFLPIALLVMTRGIGAIYWMPILSTYPVWATSLIVVAGTIGIIFGTSRSMEFYGHLLFLESPKRPKITFLLWFALIIIGLVSYVLFDTHFARGLHIQ